MSDELDDIPDFDDELESSKSYNCYKCQDTGFIFVAGAYKKCGCQLKKELKSYLTGELTGVQISNKIRPSNLTKNILFLGYGVSSFRVYVKSFLTISYLSGARHTYLYMMGSDILDYHFDTDGTYEITQADFLFLRLGRDVSNKLYEGILLNLLTYRLESGRKTWIYLYEDLNEMSFKNIYGNKIFELINRASNFETIQSKRGR
ncbi:hypothetical protein ThvES_00018520 [Thiovulum sp. ES]|nr:hypothetical protein ThvES_00018520 [Thiovulum sp. ES]